MPQAQTHLPQYTTEAKHENIPGGVLVLAAELDGLPSVPCSQAIVMDMEHVHSAMFLSQRRSRACANKQENKVVDTAPQVHVAHHVLRLSLRVSLTDLQMAECRSQIVAPSPRARSWIYQAATTGKMPGLAAHWCSRRHPG